VLTNTGLVHKCMCIDGYFQDGDQCIKNPARPLDRCIDQTHCINIPHTECAFPSIGAPHKVCLCAFNFDPSQDLSRCIRKAEFLNDYCDSFLQCTLLTNTVCEGSKCRCKGNTVESSTRKSCLPLVEYLGENCTENIQCTEGIGSNTECREESLTCECLQPGWVGNAGGDGCLKTADIGEPCQVDAQCTAELGEESTCTNKNECQCKGGASYLNKGCHRPSLLHRPCKANEECVLGINEYAHCMEQACECQEDAIEWNRFCYANLKIGSQCKSNEECFVPIPESSCVNLTCVCNHGMGSEFGANTCSGSGRIQFLFVVEMLFGLLSLVSCYLL
jgi:hypothetical protein